MTPSQTERLAREISKHKGQWVIVKGTQVIASSPSIKQAIDRVPREDRRHVRAQFCPTEDHSGSSFSAF